MAIKRRWIQSVMNEAKKPQPKMPWQTRKLALTLPKVSVTMQSRSSASA